MRLPTQEPARVWRAGLAMLATAAVPSVCSAQPAAASNLRAAFTLNFIKLTEWPNLKPGLPILVCVASDESVADAITQVMVGQSVGGRAIEVARVAPDGAVRDCHLLFVTERQPPRLAAILEGVKRLSMLIVREVAERRGDRHHAALPLTQVGTDQIARASVWQRDTHLYPGFLVRNTAAADLDEHRRSSGLRDCKRTQLKHATRRPHPPYDCPTASHTKRAPGIRSDGFAQRAWPALAASHTDQVSLRTAADAHA